MTWIGLADHAGGRFVRPSIRQPDDPVRKGTVVFETRVSADRRPQDLLEITSEGASRQTLAFRAVPGRGIAMVHRDGRALVHGAIRWQGTGRMDVVRISYCWDTDRDFARLALEAPEEHAVRSVTVADPRPLRRSILRDLMKGRDRLIAEDVVFAAVSDDIEPIGPMPTLHPSCPIATPDGFRAAGDLQRGDLVVTESGTTVPVLHRIDRQVPARGSYAPVRLRAPYFGLRQDIVVAPEQRLVLRGSEVEYLFGKEAVLVPARHLASGFAARPEPCGATVRYCQLLLPGHEVIVAAGALLESLYIGRLRRKAEPLAASLLADLDRNSLPEHARPAYQVLRPFEAVTLVEQRAA